MEYKKVKLSKVANILGGFAFKSKDFLEKGIPIIKIANISNNKVLINEKTAFVSEDFLESKENFILNKGDILIALSGATTGKFGVFNSEEKSLLNQRVGRIIFKKEKLFDGYFFHYLNILQEKILKKAMGAAQPNISPKELENFEISLPPMEIQIKIANALDKAQELIDNRKIQIEKYDELLQSVFLDMFGDPVTNPKGWEKGTIRDLLLEAKYGTGKKADEKKGEYPVLRMNNITYKGNWNFRSLKYVDLEEKELEKYLVHKGDILFNRTNSKELVGKTAVYTEEKPMAYAGYLVRLRTNEKANPHYISTYLNSHYGKIVLKNMCKSIVGMANINAQEVQDIKILHPPIELQNQFVKIVENVQIEKKKMEASLIELENNFNSIMQKAFRGELF